MQTPEYSKSVCCNRMCNHATVAELVYAQDLGSCGVTHEGSSPSGRIVPLIVLAGLLAAGGCGDAAAGPEPPRAVLISPDTLRLSIGDTGQLTVTIADLSGNPLDSAEVTWTSVNPTVVTVDSAGEVAAVGLGLTHVIAVSAGFVDSAVVRTGLAFTQITAGDAHTCGLVPGGAAFCWGDGRAGQLGNGGTEASAAPGRVTAGAVFTAVTAGATHTCALQENGTPHCWGQGSLGQRGDGTTNAVSLPTPVATNLVFQSLSAGWNHTCGITTSSRLYCWGSNLFGQLGDGGFVLQLTPDSAVTADRFTDVRAGRNHTCAVSLDGQAYCWGRNDEGQLGLGSTSAPVPIPTPLPSALTFRTIVAADGTYSCGLWLTRRLLCWGRGNDGQLGTGTTVERDSLVVIDFTIPFAAVDAGTTHTCGTTTEFQTYCWGTSRLGLPGATRSNVPLRIPIALTTITTGTFHTCGLSGEPGQAYCWGGNNRGQLGTGSAAPSDVPELVAQQIRF